MRLDEWQKYIEAQFLDDLQSPTADNPRSQPVAPEAEPPRNEVPLHLHVDHVDAVVAIAVNEIEPIGIDVAPIPRSEAVAPIPDTCKDTEFIPIITTSAPASVQTKTDFGHSSHETPARFGPLPEIDVAIPAFDKYLPPSHPAARLEAIVKTEIPPLNASRRPPVNDLPCVEPPLTGSPDPIPVQSLPTLSPDFEVATDQSDDRPEDQEPYQHPPAALRRTPRSRARHARNVRPDNVPSGLSAGELWAKVPRHVQTLLALERLGEDQEVAQFSYKRPFQEKRHELIERLLDPILSLEDTARLLNVCPTTVRRYTNKGILTYYRKEPERTAKSDNGEDGVFEEACTANQSKETRQRRFRLSDILAFLETQQAALEADRKA